MISCWENPELLSKNVDFIIDQSWVEANILRSMEICEGWAGIGLEATAVSKSHEFLI